SLTGGEAAGWLTYSACAADTEVTATSGRISLLAAWQSECISRLCAGKPLPAMSGPHSLRPIGIGRRRTGEHQSVMNLDIFGPSSSEEGWGGGGAERRASLRLAPTPCCRFQVGPGDRPAATSPPLKAGLSHLCKLFEA